MENQRRYQGRVSIPNNGCLLNRYTMLVVTGIMLFLLACAHGLA